MTKIDRLDFIRSYLFSRRYFLWLGLTFYLLIGLMSFLYAKDRSMIYYLGVLTTALSSPFLLRDAWIQYRTYKWTSWRREGVRAESPTEALLKKRLEESQFAHKRASEEARQRAAEQEDYFTLWAHQIKTPIAASRLLIDSLEPGDKKVALQGEIFKIEAYAGNVLQYLRLSSFHDDLVLERVFMEDLVKEVVKKFSIFFIHQGLSLKLHDLDQSLLTDRKWLAVVLEQLISNSLKYTKEGGIEIWMEGERLLVKDTGLGIRKSDLERVFERGFSGYNGRLTQQSSGLGLYLSRQIIDRMGNSMTLESEPGQGTLAKIDLSRKDLLFD